MACRCYKGKDSLQNNLFFFFFQTPVKTNYVEVDTPPFARDYKTVNSKVRPRKWKVGHYNKARTPLDEYSGLASGNCICPDGVIGLKEVC